MANNDLWEEQSEVDRMRARVAELEAELHGIRRSVGFGTKDGLLHLFRDADGLRKWMDTTNGNWGCVGWIEGIEVHGKGEC